MNKKTLQKILQQPDYNQNLFTQAVSVAQSCQQVISKLDSIDPKQKSKFLEKERLLENALKNAIHAFGKFCGVQKSTLATPLDHSVQIFETISDSIETSVQKYRQANKNTKTEKDKIQKPSKQFVRPQDKYTDIKPAKFEFHSHQKDLSSIRTDINVTKSQPLDESYCYVSTRQQLQNTINDLVNQPEIAIDLQHSNKSYQGFTCLIQISSRTKDYIIDVFPLWSSIPLLKQIIQNAAIIKVMHGAQMDTKWLQRDFNIHIHNLFDTYRAARTLGLQKLSYAFLLNHYCNVLTDKTYQTADWRQRPLSNQMLHYARLDTHYLLEIFDRMRADIQQKALTMGLNPFDVLTQVYSTSHQVTRNEVELFEFWKKDCLAQLRKDYKQPEYQLFESIFGIINQIAKQLDISFDEIVTHKVERLIISKLKELLIVKPQNVSFKIDKLISELGQSQNKEYFKNYLIKIKESLESYFAKRTIVPKKEKKIQKTIVTHIQEEAATFEQPPKSNYMFSINFRQYKSKTYQNLSFNPFTFVKFEPIASFLAKKIGVEPKNQQEIQEEQNSNEMVDQMEEEVSQQQKQQSNEQGGVIEFKRINPNVIYTIEEEEPAEQNHKPRKKRKEYQYEQKIKQKSGNIYQLLQE